MSEEESKKEYFYFVDHVKYETAQGSLTGSQIKAAIPNFNPSYSLYLEEQGDKPDLLVSNDQVVSLNSHPPRMFYTAPPATFGTA